MMIIEILLLATGIIALSLTIALYIKIQTSSFSYFKRLAENWNSGVVHNISRTTLLSCPSTQKSLIIDQWPGTVKGCVKSLNSIRQGGCGKYGTGIPALDPIPYTKWRGVSLCSDRASSSYLDLTVVPSENMCPEGLRSCGIIDTLNNVMCVPTATPCPYNYMKIIPFGQALPTEFNYTSFTLKDATLVLSNENIKGKILVDLTVSEDIPCADPLYKNNNYPPFILEKFYFRSRCDNSLGSKQYDTEYEHKDSYSYYNVYSENGVIVFLNYLPTFPEYGQILERSNRQLRLYSKNYVGITPSCFNKI
jgi:hypothetical protein